MSTLNVVTVNFAALPEAEGAEVRATVGTANWTWGSGFLRDEPVNLLPVYSGGGSNRVETDLLAAWLIAAGGCCPSALRVSQMTI